MVIKMNKKKWLIILIVLIGIFIIINSLFFIKFNFKCYSINKESSIVNNCKNLDLQHTCECLNANVKQINMINLGGDE